MKYDNWDIARAILPVANRVLLYGPPSTGKTHAGLYEGLKDGQKAYSFYITQYTPVVDIRGGLQVVIKDGEKTWEWQDGPALELYRNGGRLVINELDQASDDCITFLLALLDDPKVSRITLPTGETIRPHKNFTCVATMNAQPMVLLEALRSRFPVTINIDQVNPQALLALPQDLRKAAENTIMLDEYRRVDMRQWLSYATLREEVDPEMAMQACFGNQAYEIFNALTMVEGRDDYR